MFAAKIHLFMKWRIAEDQEGGGNPHLVFGEANASHRAKATPRADRSEAKLRGKPVFCELLFQRLFVAHPSGRSRLPLTPDKQCTRPVFTLPAL